jgi:hypothetical protein
MTYPNAKRQRTTVKRNVCILPSDSPSKQLSIRSFCFRRPAKMTPHTPPTPSPRIKVTTPPTENTIQQEPPPSPKSPPAFTKANHKKRQLAQVFLDCGQKHWGQEICDKCGTLYVPGVPEDTKMHNQVCQPISLGVPWHSTSNIKVLHHFQQNKFSILLIRPSEYNKHKAKLQKIISIVEKDLGMENSSDTGAIIFLCLHDNRAVGFLSVKPVSVGYPLLNLYERGTTPVPCTLGVAVLWTHSKVRHQGMS